MPRRQKQEHDGECECCKHKHDPAALAAYLKKAEAEERGFLKKYGWYVHAVTSDDDQTPNGVNIHTHGLSQTQDHLDFQCCARVDPVTVHSWLAYFAEQVKNGTKFSPGLVRVPFCKFKLALVKARECDRDVLRIVIPDSDGDLDPKTMDPEYAEQYDKFALGYAKADLN